jgi:hypothetical protein
MKKFIVLFLFLCTTYLSGQTYLHGTTGIRNERVTNCVVSTCSGTYLDNGGAAGNYSSNIAGGLYRVFCPSTVGNCVSVTFNSFRTESGFDYLTIGNGATQNSPVFTNSPATVPSGRISGTPAVPFTYTANNPSGCLTFRFTSDGSITDAGWSASLSCVPCTTVGNGPNLTDNNDCSRATRLCSGVTYNTNSRGPGLVAEGCVPNSCPAGGENHSNWYTFTIATSGTLTMLIDPQTNTDDYDFAIWGPNVTCTSLGSPLRCTDSGGTGNTGLNTTSLDNIEDVSGDKFLAQMNVVAGQTYIMVVDEWLSNTGNGYDLSFGGTATLDCAILPIKLIYFGADYIQNAKDASITFGANVDYLDEYFVIEKSLDGIEYDSIGVMYPTQVGRNDFQFMDESPVYNGFTYYRLKMVEADFSNYSDVSAIAVDDYTNQIILHPNPFNDHIKVQNFGDYYGLCEVKIYNTMGTEVISQSFQFGIINKMEINTKELSSGIYTAVIKTNGNTDTYKIIK